MKLKRAIESRWRRLSRITRWVVISIVVLLVAIRLALPYIIEQYVNKQLAKLPEYTGHVGTIDVHLWRGAYQIRDLKLLKKDGKVPVPFFATPLIDLSLQWHEIFHGKIAGKIFVDKPELNFVSGPTTNDTQSGENQPWEKTVASFYPFDLNQFEIKRGAVHFKDFYKKQPVDIYVTNLFLVATNLTNNRNQQDKLPAGIQARGVTLGEGEFHLTVKLNPLATAPTYEMNMALTNVNLVELNDFMRAFAKIDVAKGNLDLFTTVASADGAYKGTVKILFKNLDVWQWDKERKKNVLEIFWEAIVGTLSAGFKNHPHNQLATEVPISGSYSNSHVGVLPAIGNLLKNAFIRALVPGIDKPAAIEDVEKSKPDKADKASSSEAKPEATKPAQKSP